MVVQSSLASVSNLLKKGPCELHRRVQSQTASAQILVRLEKLDREPSSQRSSHSDRRRSPWSCTTSAISTWEESTTNDRHIWPYYLRTPSMAKGLPSLCQVYKDMLSFQCILSSSLNSILSQISNTNTSQTSLYPCSPPQHAFNYYLLCCYHCS